MLGVYEDGNRNSNQKNMFVWRNMQFIQKGEDSFKFGYNLVFTFLFIMKSKDFESRKAKQQFALSYLGTYSFKLCVIFFESFLHL